VALVETARALVLLEHPEAKAPRTPLLGEREQLAADSAALIRRPNVEVLEHVAAERGEAYDATLLLVHPDLVVAHDDLAHEPARVVVRVQPRQVGHRRAGREEAVGDRRRVAGLGTPHRHSGQPSEAAISYQRTVSSTCAGVFGVPTQAIFHVYVPAGSG